MMPGRTGGVHRLSTVLKGFGGRPIQGLAILVTETGALECVEREGDPNFIDRLVTMTEEGVRRTFTHRYVRTDLTAQTGHRVYILHEINSGDVSSQTLRRRADIIDAHRALAAKRQLARAAGDDRRCCPVRADVSGLPDEDGDDET